MKIKGFDRAIIYHFGTMEDNAKEGKENIKAIHRDILMMAHRSDNYLMDLATGKLSALLEEHAVHDPEGCYMHMGFKPFVIGEREVYAIHVPGTKAIAIQVEKRERVLPSISVAKATEERMKALIEKEVDGWKPTRKDWAAMRDEVKAEMLKTAPIRPSVVNIILDSPFEYVFTSSAKVAEECNSLVRNALGSWPVVHALVPDFALRQYMSGIVQGTYEQVRGGAFAHLKHDDGEDIKFKDIDVHCDETVTDYIRFQHYTPRALDIELRTGIRGIDTVSYRLSDKAILTGLTIGDADVDANYDATLAQYDNDSGQFVTMMANLLQLIISLQAVCNKFYDDGKLDPEVNIELGDKTIDASYLEDDEV